MKTFIHGVGLQDLPKDEVDRIKAKRLAKETDFRGIRSERNLLLQETDWIVTREKEKAGSIKNFEALVEYRQELRDIPNKYDKVSLVKWPTKPEIET